MGRVRIVGWALSVVAACSMGLAQVATAATGVARITFAANCANVAIAACEAEPFGIRYTVDLHTDWTADVTGSFSKRNPGNPGAGAGGDPLHTTIAYSVTTGPAGLTVGVDPNNRYYNIDLGNGPLSFPVTPGHFNAHFASGVQIESTVVSY